MPSVKEYVVQWGDTLTGIARENKTTIDAILDLNPSITDPDVIIAGESIVISGTAAPKKTNYTSRATIDRFGLQSGTDRTIYATWTWTKDNTDHYEYLWQYGTGDDVAFIGSEGTSKYKQSLYTMPENARKCTFKVRPISKTYKSGDKDVHYWTASWSTVESFTIYQLPPDTPPVPTVTIEDYVLTATLENLTSDASNVEFQVVRDNGRSVYKSAKVWVPTFETDEGTERVDDVSYAFKIEAGSEYKVRARAIRGDLVSEWSAYSDDVGTMPSPPDEITSLYALTESSVYISWPAVKTAESYAVEYTTDRRMFDSSSDVQSTTVESVVHHADITGLTSGEEWFFRVRAINAQGESPWTEIKSVKIGTAPAVPTTYSSTTTAITGEDVTLYWMHNTEDGSSQTYARLEITIGGKTTTHVIENSTDEDEKDKVSSYAIKTSGYTEGTKILWRVQTRGILADYSDWSIQRTIDIYAPPTMELTVRDADGNSINELKTLPFFIVSIPGPKTQKPIGYQVSLISNDVYETVDNVGRPVTVNKGEEVYTRYFSKTTNLTFRVLASHVSLENNVTYTVKVIAYMNSGLSAEETRQFKVAWSEDEYWPNAEIAYDKNTYTTLIRPYVTDEAGKKVSGTKLSVYRREFNGDFTEIATNVSNWTNSFVTDPHPALDYARYRIIATEQDTGKITYYDMPGYPIQEKAIIIQWDEEWTEFDVSEKDEPVQPAWTGSLLRLPYNVDVSNSHSPDVSNVEYIGRKHPVSYYGTQLGETASWSVAIDKKDVDTLYAIRRLAAWMGNVYVREPSGSGYWANITVSFSQKHLELTIPVTFDITRVEGGM